MSSIRFWVTGLLLIATQVAHIALADDKSMEDRLSDLVKKRAGAAGTASQGAAAAIGAIVNGRPRGNASTGHGADAAVAEIAAFRAQQKALAEKEERIRMEEEAKKHDVDMKSECASVVNSDFRMEKYIYTDGCRKSYRTYRAVCGPETDAEANKRDELYLEQIRIDAENRRRELQVKVNICNAWKAEGPKVNSETFKAQLRHQDEVIAAAHRISAEKARQLDAMIQADIKRAKEAKNRLEAEQSARLDAERKTEVLRQAESSGKAKADEEARRSKFRIVNTKKTDYQLDNDQTKTWCESSKKELREGFSGSRNELISMGDCTCKLAKTGLTNMLENASCEFPYSYKEFQNYNK